MSDVRSRWVNDPGHDVSDRAARPGVVRSCPGDKILVQARVLWTVVVLLLGAMAAMPASAQDEPPKLEPPKSAPPPLPETPQRPEPPTAEVQKKDSAPAEQQKGAPTAPGEEQKSAPAVPDPASQKVVIPETKNDPKAALDAAEALSTRYRFVERYDTKDDAAAPLITQYRVGVLETTKYVTEKAQGAPERRERSRIMKYTERAAKVSKLGEPTDLIRRYDRVKINDFVQARAVNPPFLEGLTLWYHKRPPLRPEIMSLTEGRPLREDEYRLIANSASDVSISQLSAFFPQVAKRVSDTWRIPPSAVQSISGKLPESEGYELTGTLLRVSRLKDGKSLAAEIGIKGTFDLDSGPSAFNARIDFVFQPRGVALPAAGAEGASKVVEATGRITQALLSHATSASVPDTDGRLQMQVTYELVMERRELALAAGERGTAVAPLSIPEATPLASQANSWVTYEDPAGRFHFRHPQELSLNEKQLPNLPAVQLADVRPTGAALLALVLPSSRGDTERDLRFRDAPHYQKAIEDQFSAAKDGITWGSADWLEDEDWQIKKRKVFRMEGACKRDKDDRPVYIDFYLVHDDNGSKSFSIEAWMGREGHVAFRKQVEDVIRSFQWGPAEKRSPAAAPAQAASAANRAPADVAPLTNPGVAPLAPATAPGSPPR